MRSLVTDPLWKAEDLGKPLPETLHACSVSLPTWASVIGYEEGDPAVTSTFQAGYPRFFIHPLVTQFMARAEEKFCRDGQKCFLFPTEKAALAAVEFARRDEASAASAIPWAEAGLWVVSYTPSESNRVKLYWRFAGQVVSSRWAEVVLAGQTLHDLQDTALKGQKALLEIKTQLAIHSGQPVENVFVFGSGMAAVFAAHAAVIALKPGQKSVQLGFPYVDVLKVQEEFGSGVHFLPGVGEKQLSELRSIAAQEPLAAIFCELPSNPLLECVDLPKLRAIASQNDIPIIADDTVATVINADAFADGRADLVTTSLTKAFSGKGDVMAGSVIVNEQSPWAQAFKDFLAQQEAIAPLFGADAVQLAANATDFASRVALMSQSAQEVAEYLANHRAVAAVYYPGLDVNDPYNVIRRQGGGAGMLLSFVLKDSTQAPKVFDALRVCKGPSLGTEFSLACPYTLLAHYPELEWAESCGVSRHLIRLSCGIEGGKELIGRLEQALALAVGSH